jgi:HD-GYP domain-containing protein (c-di-GMP phosphodiesterase class II)
VLDESTQAAHFLNLPADHVAVHRLRFVPVVGVVAAAALIPALVLGFFGTRMVMPPMWVHFYGVGVTALVATAAAVALTWAGVRANDARTVVIGAGFSVMAALLAVHGLVTPGMLVGPNGLIALSGAATLPVGGAVLVICAFRQFASPTVIPRLLKLQVASAAAIVALSLLGVLSPSLVPPVPAARSAPALALLAVGLALFGVLAVRAARTFLLTHRLADMAVVLGLVFLSASLYGALVLSFMDFGWWFGHILEFAGIALIGASATYDLHRAQQSRALVGDLRAGDIVTAEEAFLGARVRALLVRLGEKDASTERHTRRVASLAVQVGEQLGLPPTRLRTLAMGGLLHDIGKLSVPSWILKKPAALSAEEYDVIKRHPDWGRALLRELGGFEEGVLRLVLDHHERLDGKGYPNGRTANQLDLETRILSVCDVYDALVSPRVYRQAWPTEKALDHVRHDAGAAFDPMCVEALFRVVGHPAAELPLAS